MQGWEAERTLRVQMSQELADELTTWNMVLLYKLIVAQIAKKWCVMEARKNSVASARDLYQPSDRRLSANLVPTLADRGCYVVSVTDSYGRILGFLDRSHCFFFQVAAQLYSRGWVDPVPDPLLLRKSGSAGNRTRTSGFVARNSDH
jgi:hypothetical protein